MGFLASACRKSSVMHFCRCLLDFRGDWFTGQNEFGCRLGFELEGFLGSDTELLGGGAHGVW